MIKIAIPVVGELLNNHFGHTKIFHIYEIKDDVIINETVVVPPPHKPGLLPRWLADRGVTDVIAGGIGEKAITLLSDNKINIFVGVATKFPKELVEDYINGTLETNDNVCNHD